MVISILLCTVAVSVTFAAPAQQERFGTLESLSAYFPKDTMLYAATRTDANFVAVLDQLTKLVISQLPKGILPPEEFPSSLTAALDLLSGQAVGGNFADQVRPWLGDTVAVGIYPAIRSAGGRIVVKITDQKGALAAAQKAFKGWTSQTANGFTVLANSTDRNRVAIYPDVMIIYSWSDDSGPQPTPQLSPNVTNNPYYTTVLERLPDTTYDMLAFVDTPLMVAYSMRNDYNYGGDWVVPAAMLRALGSTGIGAHVGSDQTLTVDAVQTIGNKAGLDSLGIQFTGKGAALNTDILQHVPRQSVFVMQAADVGSLMDFVGNSAQSAARKFQTMLPSLITGAAYSYSAGTAGLVSGGFGGLINTEWANVFFSNLSGYDYTTEIRPLLSGNSALFLTLNPAFKPNSPTFLDREPFDGALIFEAQDAVSAQRFVSKLQRELAISIYSSGDHNAARIQEVALPGGAQGISLDVYGETGQSFDQFIAASQDNLLIIGTSRAVKQVLSGDGLGFNANPASMLPNAGTAFYVNLPAAQSPEWTNLTQADPGNLTLQVLPFLVQNLMFSAAGTEQNDLLMRLTLTVPCGENCG
jgi:hypothetical protein